MKIYDISRELMSAEVYPDDIKPKLKKVSEIARGRVCNVTNLEMCLHNGTHIDAPKHFFDDKHDIEQLGVSVFCGVCDVVSFDDHITGEDINKKVPADCERLIIKSYGKGRLTFYSLMDIISTKIKLIGIDDISVGIVGAENQIHKELLGNGIVILEGLKLDEIPDGRYVLVCEPIKISGADAAPCRAILLKDIMLF
ncbi:MAG: cyclase family protein [Acutalibacteraceae bacterium]